MSINHFFLCDSHFHVFILPYLIKTNPGCLKTTDKNGTEIIAGKPNYLQTNTSHMDMKRSACMRPWRELTLLAALAGRFTLHIEPMEMSVLY